MGKITDYYLIKMKTKQTYKDIYIYIYKYKFTNH